MAWLCEAKIHFGMQTGLDLAAGHRPEALVVARFGANGLNVNNWLISNFA